MFIRCGNDLSTTGGSNPVQSGPRIQQNYLELLEGVTKSQTHIPSHSVDSPNGGKKSSADPGLWLNALLLHLWVDPNQFHGLKTPWLPL
jgi:hypothetical protein